MADYGNLRSSAGLEEPASTIPAPAKSGKLNWREWLWAKEPGQPEGKAVRRKRLARQHLLPLGLYLLITLVISFPLILDFGGSVIGDNGDAWQNIWNYWWTNKALLGRHNPYHTDYLYSPYGVPLYLHSLNLFNGLFSMPFQWLFGLVAAYNALVLISFTLAGYFSYLLVTKLTGNRRAGFVGGVIYAFSSYQMTQLFLGQANLFASEWIPAFAFCLVGANENRGRRRTLFGVGAVIALVLIMLCDWQYIIFAALFMGLYTLYAMLVGRSFKPLLVSLVIGLLYLPFALPLMLKTFAEINSKVVPPTADSFVRAYSADLLSFFLPSPRQVLLGGWANSISPVAIDLSHNRAIFLGLFAVLLALAGLRRAGWQAFFWIGLILVSFVLALGPYLQVGGVLHDDIHLPFGLISQVPGLNVARVPVRFVLLMVLALAALGGYGWLFLQRFFKGRSAYLATGLVCALLLAEHLAVPFPSNPAPVPQFYRQLASSPEQGAILEIPYSKNRSISLYYQTIHQHPVVGGYLSRVVDYPVVDLPPLSDMPNRDGQDITVVTTSESDLGAKMLAYEKVHWIVILLNDPQLNRASLPVFIQKYAASPEPIYRDNSMEVYRPKAPASDAPQFFLQTAGGWQPSEPSPLGPTKRMRWFERRGGLFAWNISDAPQNAVLTFDVWSFHQPRHLTLRLNGSDIGNWTVGDLQHLSIPLNLTPGQHQLELRSPTDPPTRPVDVGLGNDQRPLSFGVSNLELKANR